MKSKAKPPQVFEHNHRLVYKKEDEAPQNPDDSTAECNACGEEHVGTGTPVFMVVPGMIFPSVEFDEPMFLPDPDVELRIAQLPNGQLGLMTDQNTTLYVHEECYEALVNEKSAQFFDDDDEDEEICTEDEDFL